MSNFVNSSDMLMQAENVKIYPILCNVTIKFKYYTDTGDTVINYTGDTVIYCLGNAVFNCTGDTVIICTGDT